VRKKTSLQEQIERSRKAVARWPKWMRDAAYFACIGRIIKQKPLDADIAKALNRHRWDMY
jgi:hypothetical protein